MIDNTNETIYNWECNYSLLSQNKSLQWSDVLKNLDKPWSYHHLSRHPNITWEIVKNESDKQWSYTELSRNPNITWEIVKSEPDKPWSFEYLSLNPNIDWSIVKSESDKPWSYKELSRNPNITWQIVLDNPDKPWSYEYLSQNPNIDWQIVLENPDYPWDYRLLTMNPNITLEIILKNPDYSWAYNLLSENKNITWQDVLNAPQIEWDYGYLSQNPNIDWQIVLENPDKPWSYYNMMINPSMLKRFLEPNIKIVSHSQSPGKSMSDFVVFCARVSNPQNQELNNNNDRLINYLIKHSHWSPFEMVSICLEITTTRDISRQILRHRSFSFQEFSQRYAQVETKYVFRECRLQDKKNRQNSFETSDKMLQQKWDEIQDEVSQRIFNSYEKALKMGIAKEVARVLLPEGMTSTTMYMNGTLRSWIHYIQLRTQKDTQKEHRHIALECAYAIYKVFPQILEFVA